MDVPQVSFTSSTFIGIVGAHFAKAPIGHWTYPRVSLFVGEPIKGSIGSIDQQVDGLGRIHDAVRETSLRRVLQKVVAAAGKQCGTS